MGRAGREGGRCAHLPFLRVAVAVSVLLAGLASSLLLPGRGAILAATTTSTSTSTTTTGTTTTSTAPAVLALTGHGWGHGLGLSQWGAYGYAKHGWTYDRILAHYYVGTKLGAAPAVTLRVLLTEAPAVSISSTVPWRVVDHAGMQLDLPAGTIKVNATMSVSGTQLTGPLTFRGAQPLTAAGRTYRGSITIAAAGKRVDAVDVVGIQNYLKGVVPSEMPSRWPVEALKAQAVAARSYALANRAPRRSFDVYADTRSQAYGGVAAETAATNAAVDATRGTVVLYAGKVADTLYSSSSGGRTASAAETTGTNVPYLVSVADPYDTASPYHNWGPLLFDATKVARLLKLAAPPVELDVTRGVSGRVTSLVATGSDESQATLTGEQLRAALGLRSTLFDPTLLQLLQPAKAVTYGGAASLTGFVRGDAGAPTLESQVPASPWKPAGEVILDDAGDFSVVVSPKVTTRYRLAWGSARVGSARVAVAPQLDVGTPSATGIAGSMAPAIAGAVVQLQQQQPDLTWLTVSSAAADATGAWSFAGSIQPGTYRVRCAPGNGLVAGVSLPFAVS